MYEIWESNRNQGKDERNNRKLTEYKYLYFKKSVNNFWNRLRKKFVAAKRHRNDSERGKESQITQYTQIQLQIHPLQCFSWPSLFDPNWVELSTTLPMHGILYAVDECVCESRIFRNLKRYSATSRE